MKAIKYFSFYILILLSFMACKPKEQARHSLGASTKEYFDIKNGSTYYYTEFSDTNITIKYTSTNYINNQANPDIENSEIMVYDLESAAGQPKFTVRCESGGSEFKDRIALLANIDGKLSIASVLFNQGGNFSVTNGNGDSVFVHPTYTIKDQVFSDVVRIKLSPSHPIYREILFAKNIGLIARIEKKENRYFYLKRYSINK